MSMSLGIGITMSEQVKRIPPPEGSATAQIEMADVPVNGNTLTVGNKTFTFTPTGAGTDEIALLNHGNPESFQGMFERVGTAININTADTLCTDDLSGTPTHLLTANTPGAAGNSIPLSITGTWATITPFSGGV